MTMVDDIAQDGSGTMSIYILYVYTILCIFVFEK